MKSSGKHLRRMWRKGDSQKDGHRFRSRSSETTGETGDTLLRTRRRRAKSSNSNTGDAESRGSRVSVEMSASPKSSSALSEFRTRTKELFRNRKRRGSSLTSTANDDDDTQENADSTQGDVMSESSAHSGGLMYNYPNRSRDVAADEKTNALIVLGELYKRGNIKKSQYLRLANALHSDEGAGVSSVGTSPSRHSSEQIEPGWASVSGREMHAFLDEDMSEPDTEKTSVSYQQHNDSYHFDDSISKRGNRDSRIANWVNSIESSTTKSGDVHTPKGNGERGLQTDHVKLLLSSPQMGDRSYYAQSKQLSRNESSSYNAESRESDGNDDATTEGNYSKDSPNNRKKSVSRLPSGDDPWELLEYRQDQWESRLERMEEELDELEVTVNNVVKLLTERIATKLVPKLEDVAALCERISQGQGEIENVKEEFLETMDGTISMQTEPLMAKAFEKLNAVEERLSNQFCYHDFQLGKSLLPNTIHQYPESSRRASLPTSVMDLGYSFLGIQRPARRSVSMDSTDYPATPVNRSISTGSQHSTRNNGSLKKSQLKAKHMFEIRSQVPRMEKGFGLRQLCHYIVRILVIAIIMAILLAFVAVYKGLVIDGGFDP